jgi:hypothetical protein
MARTLRCKIEDLGKWHPWFFLEPQIVACVAVLARYGASPARIDVDCLNIESAWLRDAEQFRLEVSWSPETEQKAGYGDRTDYRSTRTPCMLEVSGTETPGELGRRHRQKIAQASLNPLGWDAYVVVCAFSSLGHRIRLSFHRVQEPGL